MADPQDRRLESIGMEVSVVDETIKHMLLRDQGTAVEDYARRLAGVLGVPDFVYQASVIRKGSGTREVGDGLLAVGSEGLVVQVKSRLAEASYRDDLAKAGRWCRKHAEVARGQGIGTRRRLASGNVRIQSLRGYPRTLPSAQDWPIVVVIDHPLDPPVVFKGSSDTLYLSLDDWLGVHSMIPSPRGVIAYVHRALATGRTIPLG